MAINLLCQDYHQGSLFDFQSMNLSLIGPPSTNSSVLQVSEGKTDPLLRGKIALDYCKAHLYLNRRSPFSFQSS